MSWELLERVSALIREVVEHGNSYAAHTRGQSRWLSHCSISPIVWLNVLGNPHGESIAAEMEGTGHRAQGTGHRARSCLGSQRQRKGRRSSRDSSRVNVSEVSEEEEATKFSTGEVWCDEVNVGKIWRSMGGRLLFSLKPEFHFDGLVRAGRQIMVVSVGEGGDGWKPKAEPRQPSPGKSGKGRTWELEGPSALSMHAKHF
ncbi:hypothetical protein B0T17DRAFT_510558 [Bombardia bombarda]|uniref:Uncharacterized protein n=1 Tax=Bombardia bombarda TaxID=252184 RepID=A0AA39WIG5_9PEZI|nr:hypothetical protein B0T17DRAFT_510558 [Bombardia bombarda]